MIMAEMYRVAERTRLTRPIEKSENTATDPYASVAAASRQSGSPTSAGLLDLSSEDFLKSIILAEVLGKPKSMRKARW